MSNLLLVLMMMVTLIAPLAGPRNRPPIANDDIVVLLYHLVAVVNIAVLENDVDPDQDPLLVTSLSITDGGKAEIVKGKVVQVTIDWPQDGFGDPQGLMASGSYVVSDGVAQSKATWSVWYWPEMQP